MKSYCVFNIGEKRVGIDMSSVKEIIDWSALEMAPLPLAPDFFHGLFNLRGQVLPFLNLGSFVGSNPAAARPRDRAVIIERGDFRFGTIGQLIDTVEADEQKFQPLSDVALFPALEAQAECERGSFQVIHLDRLEACLNQAMKFSEIAN
jgi:chemotaxis signal transduction protein